MPGLVGGFLRRKRFLLMILYHLHGVIQKATTFCMPVQIQGTSSTRLVSKVVWEWEKCILTVYVLVLYTEL